MLAKNVATGFIQAARRIDDVLREQARSHGGLYAFSCADCELLPKIWTVLLSGSRLGPVGHSASRIISLLHLRYRPHRFNPALALALALALFLILILGAPSNHAGRTSMLSCRVNRQDAGLAALGQGWPFAAALQINVGVRACRAWARDRVVGQEPFAYFWASKVRRRKGATLSRRDRSNGYVPSQQTGFIQTACVIVDVLRKQARTQVLPQKNRPEPVFFITAKHYQNEALAKPSRYRSTSSAAMQPAPAEVIA